MPLTEQEEKTATPAGAWKRPNDPQGFIVELPSGNFARVIRSVNFFTMLKENRIPNPVAEVINSMIEDKKAGQEPDQSKVDVNAATELLKFIDTLLVDVMIEPRFIIPPATFEEKVDWVCPEGFITPADMSDDDKFYLFTVAVGGATDLEQFRAEQRAAMAIASDVAEVQSEAKPVSRSGRPLPGVVS